MDTQPRSAYSHGVISTWLRDVPVSKRGLKVASAFLLLAGMNMLVLGGMHHHHLTDSVQVTNPHVCFLCQVSPNVDVDEDLVRITDPHEVRRTPAHRRDSIHVVPVVADLRSRAPPPE